MRATRPCRKCSSRSRSAFTSQTSISFTSSPPIGAAIGDPAYTVTATATSGLAVTFSADASSAGICTVSGSTVSLVGAGTCKINANQPGNASYQAASQVQQSFVISPHPLGKRAVD